MREPLEGVIYRLVIESKNQFTQKANPSAFILSELGEEEEVTGRGRGGDET